MGSNDGLRLFIGLLLLFVVLHPFVVLRKAVEVPPTGFEESFLDIPSDQSTLGCLEASCIHSEATKLARSFPSRANNRQWCVPPNTTMNEGDPWKGLLLVKVPKGASSTSAGVAIRIGRNRDCKVQWMHRMASDYRHRSPDESFLFTTIRDPSARAISTIFFHVISRKPNVTVTDEFLQMQLRNSKHPHYGASSDGRGGFQLRYTRVAEELKENSVWSPRNRKVVRDPERVIEAVRDALEAYDFFLVTERMDESLVAMAMVMGLDVGDVLVTSSKVAGSNYHFVKMAGGVFKCLPTTPSFVTAGVQAFLDSDEWRAMNYGDLLLHEAASLSLDLTIDNLGRDRFDEELARYRRLRTREAEICAPHVKFPCNNQGVAQPKKSKESCYLPFYDFGCGYKCIDQMIFDEAAKSQSSSG